MTGRNKLWQSGLCALLVCLGAAPGGACLPADPAFYRAAPSLTSPIDSFNPAFVHKFLGAGQYFPLSRIRPGMVGYGLSVFQGNKIERFDVRIIGIVKKVLNGRDAILVKMSGAPLANNNVIKGMSGSPVYIDGKLIGAISFGFDFAKEPIAGITPIVDMLDAMAPGQEEKDDIAGARRQPWYAKAGDVAGQHAAGGIIAAGHVADDTAPERNTSGSDAACTGSRDFTAGAPPRLVPLLSPVGLVGFSSSAEHFLASRFKNYGMTVSSGASGGIDPALGRGHSMAITPGGSVSVLLATGDFNVVATGTVTACFGKRVLAFGHPFLEAGAVDFPLATAYVHDVLPSLFVSFKLASPVAVVGALTADRPWSVGGRLGASAHMIPATYQVTDLTRGISRTFHCQVIDHPDLTPDLLASTAMSAIESTHQSNGPYVASVESIIDAGGISTIKRTDCFSSNFSAHKGSDAGKFHFLADPVGSFLLKTTGQITGNSFVKSSIKSVDMQITLDDGHKTARLEKVYIDRPFVAPGQKLDVHCLLKPYNGKDTVETLSFTVPADMPDGQMLIGVAAGDEIKPLEKRLGIVEPAPRSLSEIAEHIRASGRGDAIELVCPLPGQSLIVGGARLVNLPAYWVRIFKSEKNTSLPAGVKEELKVSKATRWLVDGSHILTVEVRNPEKVLSRKAPYSVSLPDADQSIITTEQAGKAIDSSKKSTEPQASTTDPGDKDTAPESAGILDQYPHMRPIKTWTQQSQEDFNSGKCKSISIDSWGRLLPGPVSIAEKRMPQAGQIWSGVCSGGYFWFGEAGNIWRWAGGTSQAELVARLPAAAITSMAADSKGTIYAACIPAGDVYALAGKGKQRLVCHTPGSIITSLCLDDKDNLYIGTAGSGKIYKKASACNLTEFFSCRQEHILSLFFCRKDNQLYAGCGENGVVYAIDRQGHARTVYQAGDHFVTGAVRDSCGDLYICTAGAGHLVRVRPDKQVDILASSEAFYRLYYDRASDSVLAGDGEGDITLCRVDPVSRQSYFVPLCHTDEEEVLALACDNKHHLFAGTANLAGIRQFELKPACANSYESAVADAGLEANWMRLNARGAINEASDVLRKQLQVETRTGSSAQPDKTWSPWHPASWQNGSYTIVSAPARYLQYRLQWTMPKAAAGARLDDAARLGKVEVSYLPRDRAPQLADVSIKPGASLSGKQEVVVTGADPDSDNLLLSVEISADGGRSFQMLASDLRVKSVCPADSPSAHKRHKKLFHFKSGNDEGAGQQSQDRGSTLPASLKDRAGKDGSGNTSHDLTGLSKQIYNPELLHDEAGAGYIDKSSNSDTDEGTDKPKSSNKSEKRKNHKAAGSISLKGDKAGSTFCSREKITWNMDTTKHKDGNYILKFTLDDRLSSPDDHLTAVALRAITITNEKPKIGAININRQALLSFTVAVADDYAPITNATYKIDAQEPFALGGLAGLANGMAGKLAACGLKLSSGTHKLEIKVTDKAGNQATKTFNVK